MFKIKQQLKVKEIPNSPIRSLTIIKRTKGDRVFEKTYKEQQKVKIHLGKGR